MRADVPPERIELVAADCERGDPTQARRRSWLGGSKSRSSARAEGVWSWVHIDDAVAAMIEALTVPPGVYHVVDDDTSPVSIWLPAFGAPPPPMVSEQHAR